MKFRDPKLLLMAFPVHVQTTIKLLASVVKKSVLLLGNRAKALTSMSFVF